MLIGVLNSNSSQLLESPAFPGLQVGGVGGAVISASGEVVSAPFGDAFPGGVIAVEDTTRFGLSDISQTLLAALAFTFVEEGALNLDAQVSTYLSTGDLTNVPDDRTIRQLMNHTSGYDNFREASNYVSDLLFDPTKVFTPQEITQSFVGAPSAAGSFSYSNTNYLVLGLVIDAINGGTSIEESLQTRVLTPAGVNTIQVYDPATDETTDLSGFFEDLLGTGIASSIDPRTSIFTGASFAGNQFGTPGDVLRVLQALAGGQIINATSLQEMLTFSSISGRLSQAYGLGIEQFQITVDGSSKTVIGHAGSVNYHTLALYDPMDSIGVILMNNNGISDSSALLTVAEEFFEIASDLVSSLDPVVVKDAAYNLYPNPTSDLLRVEFDLLQPAAVQLQVIDLQGRVLLSQPARQLGSGIQLEEVPVAGLPTGTYLLQLRIGENQSSKLFNKQ